MSRPKSRRELYSEATRAALLETATAMFAERGFAGTSLDDIAVATQVTRGAVYHHFESKQAVFEAVFAAPERGLMGGGAAGGRRAAGRVAGLDGWARGFPRPVLRGQVRAAVLAGGPGRTGLDAVDGLREEVRIRVDRRVRAGLPGVRATRAGPDADRHPAGVPPARRRRAHHRRGAGGRTQEGAGRVRRDDPPDAQRNARVAGSRSAAGPATSSSAAPRTTTRTLRRIHTGLAAIRAERDTHALTCCNQPSRTSTSGSRTLPPSAAWQPTSTSASARGTPASHRSTSGPNSSPSAIACAIGTNVATSSTDMPSGSAVHQSTIALTRPFGAASRLTG